MPHVTATEAAKLRGVDKSTVTRWLSAGLRHKRYGRTVMIDTRHLDSFQPRPVGNPNRKPVKS
jgi:hypothetical protein